MASAKTALGKKLGDLLNRSDRVRAWKDPNLVWEFQSRYGVRKTGVSYSNAPNLPENFVSVDEDALTGKKQQQRGAADAPAKAPAAAAPAQDKKQDAPAPASDGLRQRVAPSEVISSSGYSSNGDGEASTNARKNVVRYKCDKKLISQKTTSIIEVILEQNHEQAVVLGVHPWHPAGRRDLLLHLLQLLVLEH